jgi:hypothetical protein
MDLIVFQESMSKRSKKSLAWSTRNITQELSKLKEEELVILPMKNNHIG